MKNTNIGLDKQLKKELKRLKKYKQNYEPTMRVELTVGRFDNMEFSAVYSTLFYFRMRFGEINPKVKTLYNDICNDTIYAAIEGRPDHLYMLLKHWLGALKAANLNDYVNSIDPDVIKYIKTKMDIYKQNKGGLNHDR